MSLKDTIVQWSEGVDLALSGKFREAISVWGAMQEPGARIYFNIASMHVLLGSIENAEKVSFPIVSSRGLHWVLQNVIIKMLHSLYPCCLATSIR